jgi:hypothetical protein
MVRRGWSCVLLAVMALSACSGDDGAPDDSVLTTAGPQAPATLPDDVAAGQGALVLGEELYTLDVVCELEPTTDVSTGVTTELLADGGDEIGTVVSVSRQSTVGDVPPVTDTIAVQLDDTVIESQRVDAGGQLIDLRLPNPTSRLIEVTEGEDGSVISAQGMFGPAESLADDPQNVDGSLLFRCP